MGLIHCMIFHVRLSGPAAASCLAVFRDRWLDHPDTPGLDKQKFQMSVGEVQKDFDSVSIQAPKELETVTAPGGKYEIHTCLWQLVRHLRNFRSSGPKVTPIVSLKEGDQSAWGLVKRGIANAKRWIYLEDQYLMSRRARAELLKKLTDPQFKFLLVLMGNSGHFENNASEIAKNEIPYLISARNEFRVDLTAIDPGRKKWHCSH